MKSVFKKIMLTILTFVLALSGFTSPIFAINESDEESQNKTRNVETILTPEGGRDGLLLGYGTFFDDLSKEYVLTQNAESNKAGTIWLNEQWYDDFTLELDYYVGSYLGADGIFISFYTDYNSDPTPNIFSNMEGYIVEIDTYGGNTNDPSTTTGGRHVALTKDGLTQHLIYDKMPHSIDDSYHHLKIDVFNSVCAVYIDGSEVFSYDVDSTGKGYIGITGLTGNRTMIQKVKNVIVYDGYNQTQDDYETKPIDLVVSHTLKDDSNDSQYFEYNIEVEIKNNLGIDLSGSTVELTLPNQMKIDNNISNSIYLGEIKNGESKKFTWPVKVLKIYENNTSSYTVNFKADGFLDLLQKKSIKFGSNDTELLEELYVPDDVHKIKVSGYKLGNLIPIENAKIVINDDEFFTDSYGIARISGITGENLVTVSADGYFDSVQYYYLQNKSMNYFILQKDTFTTNPYIVMASEGKKYKNLEVVDMMFDMGSKEEISITILANWKNYKKGKYIIYQEESTHKLESKDGSFTFAPGEVFAADKPIKAKVVTEDGISSKPVELKIHIKNFYDTVSGTVIGELKELTSIEIIKNFGPIEVEGDFAQYFVNRLLAFANALPIEKIISYDDNQDLVMRYVLGISDLQELYKGNSVNSLLDYLKKKTVKLNDKPTDVEGAVKSLNAIEKLRNELNLSEPKYLPSLTLSSKILEPSLSYLGYYEYTANMLGELINQVGGVIIEAEAKSSIKKQFLFAPVPVYVNLSGAIGLAVDLGIKYAKNKFDTTGSCTFPASISLTGGVGANGLVGVEATGKADLVFEIAPREHIEATISALIRAYLLFVIDKKWTLAEKTIPIWDGGSSQNIRMLNLEGNEFEDVPFEFIDREYTENTSDWYGQSISTMAFGDVPESIHMLQEYILPTSLPELVNVNGQRVLIFHSDYAERTVGNNVVLMYSVYDEINNTWSEPKAIAEGVSSDLYMETFVNNDELYVVWQKLKNTVGQNDPMLLIEDMAKNSDISFAKWNKTTNSFDQVYVNNDDKLDMYPYLAFDGEKISIVWVSNSESNVFGEIGTYTFYVSDYADGEWTEPKVLFETEDYVTEIAAGYANGELIVLYAVGTDTATPNIYKIVGDSSQLIDGQTAIGASILFNNGNFSWNSEGTIKQYNTLTNELVSVQSGESNAILSTYRIVNNGDDQAIVWFGCNAEGENVIYASFEMGNSWSSPVEIYKPDFIIRHFDVELEENGEWNIVCTCRESVETETVSLVHVNVKPIIDITLDYAIAIEKDRKEGIQPVILNLTNNGQSEVTGLNVVVKNANDKVYYNKSIDCNLAVGTFQEIKLEVDLSTLSGYEELKVIATANNEINTNDNTDTIEVGYTDVILDVERYDLEDAYIIKATVSNESDIPANVIIRITEDTDTGTVIAEEKCTISKRGSYVYLYAIDKKSIDLSNVDSKTYHVVLDVEEKDFNPYDNSARATIYAKRVYYKYTYNIEYISSAGEVLGTDTITKGADTVNTVSPIEFEGYSVPESQTVVWDTDVPKTIIFVYEPIDYTIAYNVDTDNPTTYNVETESFTLINPNMIGHTFKGWTGSNGNIPQEIVTIEKGSTGNKEYNANFEINNYTVIFDSCGGTSVDSITRKYQESLGVLPVTIREGYSFNGWFTEKVGGIRINDDALMPLNGATYYAQWTEKGDTKYVVNHYLMNLDGNTYTLKDTETLSGKTNASVTPSMNTYKGFITPNAKTDTIKADGSLVVDYYYKRERYTVNLEASDGISEVNGGKQYYYQENVTIDASVEDGYTWRKWNSDNISLVMHSTDKKYTFKMPENDVTLTAMTTLNNYSVTFDSNGGNVLDSNVITKAYGEKLGALPTPYRPGYRFIGWYTENVNGTKIDEESKMPLNGATYYARWESLANGVTRVFGSSRYETAFKTADTLKATLGVDKFNTAIVANGTNFADALAGSYLAAKKSAPILMTDKNAKNITNLVNYIKSNVKPGGTVYILGGYAALPNSIDKGLAGYTVKRLAGADRYETNLLILDAAGVTNEAILVATGTGFADSLSASATGLPMLLVNKELNSQQKAFLEAHKGNAKYIVGGTSAVSTKVEKQVSVYGKPERLAGNGRYDTSVLVAKKFFSNPTSAVVAYGRNFPDGLSGGPLAYTIGGPLLLAENKQVNTIANYTKSLGITSGYVLGGSGLVSDASVKTIYNAKTIK